MKTKLKLLLLPFVFSGIGIVLAQESIPNEPQGPTAVGQMTYKYVPSIAEQIRLGTFIYGSPVTDRQKMGKPKSRYGNNVVPGKGSKGPDALAENQLTATQLPTRAPSLVFNATTAAATPSDPTGAVGRDFYIAAWNTSWQIFNKDGTPATGMPNPASLGTLFGGRAPGDPICLYDSEVDRYIILQFDGAPVGGPINGYHIAISTTNDPINDGWHVYSPSDFSTGNGFPDYEKMSIWSDGYYITANISGGNGQVWALDRDEMLNGNPAGFQAFNLPGISTSGFYSPQAFNITDDNHPAAGNATFVYMADDAWAGVSNDHLKLWNLDVDFDNPANSVMSAATELPVTPFVGVFDGGNFANLTQPTGGPDIDALQAIIMNQAQFRRFGTHNSSVFNFVVDAGTGGEEIAAIRWYELRQPGDGQPWSIHQEGTYVAPENRHAWGASMAMDALGNIGMGYTTMGGTNGTLITSAYTGQFVGGTSGVMNAVEEFIQTSTAGNPNTRYADYSHLTVDPSDDATFWFDTELFTPNRSNVVGAFQLTAPPADDVGITAITSPNNEVLSDAESIIVDIRNFGTNDQSNIPVSYTIDGGAVVNDVVPGPIAGGATESFTFATPADLSITNQTYTIVATTILAGDANNANDSTTKDVTNAVNYCVPAATLGCTIDGIKRFVLGTIDADNGANGCNGNGIGYVDRRNLVTDLGRDPSENPHILQAQHNWDTAPNNEALSVWIDFNDNGTFENSERLISGVGFQTNNALEDFDLNIPADAPLGFHVLRAKAIDVISPGGDILDPCSDFDFGEVHDYTVNIVDNSLSTSGFTLEGSDFSIISQSNNQFEVIFTSNYIGDITFNVYNYLGQQVVFNNLAKTDKELKYKLDMSYASSGVYIVKMGKGKSFEVGRIIVK